MKNETLPTDEEFLETLFSVPANYENPLLNDPILLAEIIEHLVQGKVIPRDEDAKAYAIKLFDPKSSFRGLKTEILTDAAKKTLPQELHYLLNIPIGFLFIEELNGFAAPTPRGNSIIVLNLGINLHMQLLWKCIVTLTDWNSARPFCANYQPADFAYAIICLARFACTGDNEHLRQIKIWKYPSSKAFEIRSGKSAVVAEEFVLLHEYGHVACGHTNPNSTVTKFGFNMYSQDHEQEYEADSFAFRYLQQRYGHDASALIATALFRFFDLLEHLMYGKSKSSPTHPAGKERLAALKTAYNFSDEKIEKFGIIESMFDMVLNFRHDAVNRTSSKFL